MYLHEIFLQNTGPISECHVKLPVDNGNPLPVVIVGPNGSGKTIFLSYIIDALTEFSKKAFVDTVPSDSQGRTPYFRVIHQRTIRSGERFSLSLLHFKVNKYIEVNETDLYYCEKLGSVDPDSYSPDVKSVFAPVWNRVTARNYKDVLADQTTVAIDMERHAHAFFPASRREDPDWLNSKSLQARLVDYESRFSDELNKPLWIETCAEENICWVLDVFLDSFIDPDEQQRENYFKYIREYSLGQQLTLQQSRENVEQILQTILQDETAKLFLNFRNFGPSRISIGMGNGRIIPTLQSLSAGQSQLFHLFTTIIRYGEWTNLNRSLNLKDITGLVVIDEIDTHLHPTLQHDVLPELISLFPKVQFIVSSHSPLFLLGMEKRFGVGKVTILEMPEAEQINSERYSEFGKAFKFYKTTERFEEDIKQLIASATKPIVLTEGKTDARYIQTALKLLGEEELLNSLDIRPVGKEGHDGDIGGGAGGLTNFRNIYALKSEIIHQSILLLYDYDIKKIKKLPKNIEKLSVQSIPQNPENTAVPNGIENLFPEKFFKEEFEFRKEYYIKKPKDDGGHTVNLDKPKFCNWICKNGSDVDFAKFDSVVNILREFIALHQPPPDQQTLSE